MLENLKAKGKEVTLYLNTLGKKNIWKPSKLTLTKKSIVPDNFNDLLNRKHY